MGATSIACPVPTLLMMIFPPSVLDGPWPDPTATWRGAPKSYADPRGCHQANPRRRFAVVARENAASFPDDALFTGGLGAPATWIRRPEQSVVGHGDRVRRGLAERFDDGVTLRLQGCDHVVGETMLDPHFIRQPLVVQAWGGDRGRDVHIVVDHIDDDLQHRRDDS